MPYIVPTIKHAHDEENETWDVFRKLMRKGFALSKFRIQGTRTSHNDGTGRGRNLTGKPSFSRENRSRRESHGIRGNGTGGNVPIPSPAFAIRSVPSRRFDLQREVVSFRAWPSSGRVYSPMTTAGTIMSITPSPPGASLVRR